MRTLIAALTLATATTLGPTAYATPTALRSMLAAPTSAAPTSAVSAHAAPASAAPTSAVSTHAASTHAAPASAASTHAASALAAPTSATPGSAGTASAALASAGTTPATLASAGTTTRAIETCALSSLPSQASDTLDLIHSGGPFPYSQDGTVFQNREGILPSESTGYYHEYTVITPGSPDRGARRLIGGGATTTPAHVYYTGDHYSTFCELDENS